MNGKKLYKIKNGAMLAGVCNGVAAYFDVDVSLVRLAAVAAVFFTGFGLVAYIAAALILPESADSPYGTAVSGQYDPGFTQNNTNFADNTNDNGKDII